MRRLVCAFKLFPRVSLQNKGPQFHSLLQQNQISFDGITLDFYQSSWEQIWARVHEKCCSLSFLKAQALLFKVGCWPHFHQPGWKAELWLCHCLLRNVLWNWIPLSRNKQRLCSLLILDPTSKKRAYMSHQKSFWLVLCNSNIQKVCYKQPDMLHFRGCSGKVPC